MTENKNNGNKPETQQNKDAGLGQGRKDAGRKKGIDLVVKQAIGRVLAEPEGNIAAPAPEFAAIAVPAQKSPRRRRRPQAKQAAEAAPKDGQQAKQPATAEPGQPRRQPKQQKQSPSQQKGGETPLQPGLQPRTQITKKKAASIKGGSNDFKLKIIPLGGLGEIGKNMMLIQYDNDILVVDGGLSFPEDEMLGIDLVIPDITYLRDNKEKVRAFLLTHGHEDHIGGMPYILRQVQAPVYGAPLTLGLLEDKLEEHKIKADLRKVEPREELTIGVFKVEFIRVTHSIPDSMGLAIHTPIGTILLISDFKMDMSPIDGKLMDFGRISALGEKGVLLLMSDSTNVEKDGFSDSERSIGDRMDSIFMNAEGRIIVTSFASHVHRVQQALWAAQRSGRKVAVCGRGMVHMVEVAKELGCLKIPDNILIDVEKIGNFPANRIAVITTGSQGEPLSGLTRMASGEHRQVQIMAGDTVIISATPIPGNERMVSRIVDNLFRLGATVIYERWQGIHVSGHANREDLKMLQNIVKPHFFLPVHGEYRMLYKHAQLAQQVGLPPENTIILENGQVLELSRRHYRLGGTVNSGCVMIDGLGVGDVGSSVLRERRQLSEGGVVVISLVYTKNKGQGGAILLGPEICTRGFIFEKDYEHIIGEMKEKVTALCSGERLTDGSLNDLRTQVRNTISRFVMERTGRKPVIMAVISEV